MRTLLKKIIPFAFAIFSLLLSTSNAYSQNAKEFFMLGNNAYKSGDYPKAVERYEAAISRGFDGAEIRYNLANALAKLDRKGEALLNYRRAVYNSPRIREASANLKMFAKDNSLDDGFSNFTSPIIAELSDSEWTSAAFIAFWGAVLMIYIPPLFGKRRTTPTIFIAILFGAIFLISVFSISNWKNFANTAIALKPDTSIRISPTPDAPVTAIVEEGQSATIEGERGNYIYIETANGKRGWANKSDFQPILQ